jgi:hypothetical protein
MTHSSRGVSLWLCVTPTAVGPMTKAGHGGSLWQRKVFTP